jgi:predicted GTPase
MRECLIVGKPNAGKTLFFINFAEYLGLRLLWPTGGGAPLSPCQARRLLVDDTPHRTRRLQRAAVRVASGLGSRAAVLVDSTGLTEGISPDAEVRQGMARTLQAMQRAQLVLHLVDAAARPGTPSAPGEVDREVAAFARGRAGYLLLANKVDLPEASQGLRHLAELLPDDALVPVSARLGKGFPQVRRMLARRL